MMNFVWAFLILVGIFTASLQHSLEATCSGIISSSKEAVDLLLLMGGIVSMWNGFLKIAEDSGLTTRLSKKMIPFLHFLFPNLPKEHPATKYICANFIANLLGLGWACTPTGIRAMKELQNFQAEQGITTKISGNEMCTFLILNISSLQLIPINMIAYRTQYGSPYPFAIVGPALLATSFTTLLAILLCKLCIRFL